MTTIVDFFSELPLTTFLEQFYLRLPVARSVNRVCIDRTDWSEVSRLLGHPEVDAIVGRQGQRWPDGALQADQISEVMRQGYTIGLRHVDRLDAAYADIASEFQRTFGAPIDIHLYATPANQVGFGWHYDAEEVFVLQTVGSKNWWLRKNTVHPWPIINAMPTDQRYEREIMPAMHCRLEAGDWLYIPAGYWHRSQAETDSLSLSIGVRAWTALDLLDSLRSALDQSIEWRQRLPLGDISQNSAEELSAEVQAVISDFAERLAVQLQNPSLIQNAVLRLLSNSSSR